MKYKNREFVVAEVENGYFIRWEGDEEGVQEFVAVDPDGVANSLALWIAQLGGTK